MKSKTKSSLLLGIIMIAVACGKNDGKKHENYQDTYNYQFTGELKYFALTDSSKNMITHSKLADSVAAMPYLKSATADVTVDDLLNKTYIDSNLPGSAWEGYTPDDIRKSFAKLPQPILNLAGCVKAMVVSKPFELKQIPGTIHYGSAPKIYHSERDDGSIVKKYPRLRFDSWFDTSLDGSGMNINDLHFIETMTYKFMEACAMLPDVSGTPLYKSVDTLPPAQTADFSQIFSTSLNLDGTTDVKPIAEAFKSSEASRFSDFKFEGYRFVNIATMTTLRAIYSWEFADDIVVEQSSQSSQDLELWRIKNRVCDTKLRPQIESAMKSLEVVMKLDWQKSFENCSPVISNPYAEKNL